MAALSSYSCTCLQNQLEIIVKFAPMHYLYKAFEITWKYAPDFGGQNKDYELHRPTEMEHLSTEFIELAES